MLIAAFTFALWVALGPSSVLDVLHAIRSGDARALDEALNNTEPAAVKASAIELAVAGVHFGDAATIRTLTASGVRFDGPIIEDLYALEAVLLREDVEAQLVEALLAGGASVKDGAWSVHPPVSAAAMQTDPRILRTVLDAGANINARDAHSGWSPLAVAVVFGRAESVKLLLERGADPTEDYRPGENLWFALASRDNDAEVDQIAALLKGKAPDINATDEQGLTPALNAIMWRRPVVLKALLNAGARLDAVEDPDADAAVLAAQWGDLETLRIVLDSGGEASAVDNTLTSALTWAILSGDPARAATWLQDAGSTNKSPFREAELAQTIDKVKLLLARGADPNIADDDGWSALSYAAAAWDRDALPDDLTGEEIDARGFYDRHDPAALVRMLVDAGAVIQPGLGDQLEIAAWRTDAHRARVLAEVRKAKVAPGADAPDPRPRPRF